MAADVLHDAQGFARRTGNQVVFGALGDLAAQLEDDVAGMGDIFRLFEFAAAGFPEMLADAGLQFGEFPPGLQDLAVVAEGGDAAGDQVFVACFGHQGELAGDDGHGRLLRNGVAVIGDAAAGGVVRRLVEVLAEQVPDDFDEMRLGGGEETLAYAAADVEPVVVRNLFLVI